MPYLVRHAHASDKHAWTGPDRLRPLSEPGRREAHGLLTQLRDYPITRILSSPAARCPQTVEPLAQRRRLPVEPDRILGVDADPAALVALLLDPAVGQAVLCSHGELIRAVLECLVGHDFDDAVELAWPERRRARAGYGTAGDHWGVAASSLVRAQGAVHAGDISTVATMTAEILRHSEAIGYDALVVPAMLLKACVAERRNDPGAAEDAYRRALELAGESALPTTSPSPWSDSARTRSCARTRQAEELCRRALAMAEAASTSRLATHARVQLARVLEAAGDADIAETL